VESIVAAPETLDYDAARERVLAAVVELPAEAVPLAKALGRALSRPIVAPHDLPPFRNASMDGVAVRSSDLASASASAPVTLSVVDEIPAGSSSLPRLAHGQCAWIMTGAMVPQEADAVVPIEELEVQSGVPEQVRLAAPASAGQNIRDAGADARAGAEVLPAGRELSPHDLAVLASLGVARPVVGGAPRVAILSTGDELIDPSAELRPGAIRDSNLPMLTALVEQSGARVVAAERMPDDAAQVAQQIERSLGEADVVVTIGGVSAGRHDPVKLGIARLGGISLWRVAMKPGRPQAFGTPKGRLFFGLPGNPASVACVFEAWVRPALRKLQGFAELDRPRLAVRVAEAIESRAGRTDLVRVGLESRDGEWWATSAGAQISGHVLPQSRAHALLIVPAGRERLAAGETAEALLLRWPPTA
jgi:molybdopterin molybdotransferase